MASGLSGRPGAPVFVLRLPATYMRSREAGTATYRTVDVEMIARERRIKLGYVVRVSLTV